MSVHQTLLGPDGVCSVLAMGDAFGQISFWELGEKKNREGPLVLMKNDDPSMAIGNLDFDHQGNFCVASTDKKFLAVICFDGDLEEHVGHRKSLEKYLLENYGSKRPGQLEIMKTYKDLIKPKQASTTSGLTEIVESMQIEEPKKPVKHYKKGKRIDSSTTANVEANTQSFSQPLDSEIGLPPLILHPSGSNSQKLPEQEPIGSTLPEPIEKKKMDEEKFLIETDEKKPKLAASKPQVTNIVPEKETSKAFLPALPRLQDSGVWQDGKNKLQGNLQICYKAVLQDNPYTKVFVKDRWDTTVEGIATYIDSNKTFTVVYTLKGLLYILSTESGRRVEIPLKVDSLSKISLNVESYVLLLDASGKLKVITFD